MLLVAQAAVMHPIRRTHVIPAAIVDEQLPPKPHLLVNLVRVQIAVQRKLPQGVVHYENRGYLVQLEPVHVVALLHATGVKGVEQKRQVLCGRRRNDVIGAKRSRGLGQDLNEIRAHRFLDESLFHVVRQISRSTCERRNRA